MKEYDPRSEGNCLSVQDIITYYNLGQLKAGDVFEFVHKEGAE